VAGQSGPAAVDDPVVVALAEAVRLAAGAGRWDLVATLAAELQARRVAGAGVVNLDDERARRKG